MSANIKLESEVTTLQWSDDTSSEVVTIPPAMELPNTSTALNAPNAAKIDGIW